MASTRTFSLEDRFRAAEGVVAMSGVQALLRVSLDRHRADAAAGLRTATLIAGYRGSPLGGLDLAVEANRPVLDEHDVVFINGLNEDLGATAVFGSQLANLMPGKRYDGICGMWYGKAPGVDRAGDAIKHANFAGVGHQGGVLAVAGDDPADKSSTLPSQSEFALMDAQLPTLYPGSVQEVLDYGLYGFALSRYSGLWAGLKIVTNVADAYSTVRVGPDRVNLEDPGFVHDGRPWRHTQDDRLIAPFALDLEREIYEGRLEAARRFTIAHRLDQVTVSGADAWLGIVAAGKTYYDLREALLKLGLDDTGLAAHGIRLYKPAMVWPLEAGGVRAFADGLEEVLVVEEKRSFLETQVKDALYDLAVRPAVHGKRDEQGGLLVPGHGELDADEILAFLPDRLTRRISADALRTPPRPRPVLAVTSGEVARTPFFCSGCPHNRSTEVPEGSVAGGGIGCHGMSLLIPSRNVEGITQMGGEGVQWVGASPFTNEAHRFQNIGDGTFFHSGSLALRQAVSAGTNITYKLLYNGAVAMTGGQDAAGEMAVPQLTRWLEAEGVARTIVCADDTHKYPKGAEFAANASVWHRDRLDEAQRELRDIAGVTVLVYDQACAAELRRKRRRGLLPTPDLRVFINEAVCEGCGDCGAKSNCLSVQPVDTEYGRKTQIHQASCNQDYSCLDGDCPAFVTVVPEKGRVNEPLVVTAEIGPGDVAEPADRPGEGNLFLTGIGGTGVVTINQLLATAALLDGKWAASLDQTGLSQKGGPVVSNLKVTATEQHVSTKVGVGEADAYLVFDLLAGTVQKNLDRADPARTVAIVSSSEVPTGAMVSDTTVIYPDFELLRRRIDGSTRRGDNIYLDAELISRNLFRSHMPANMIVVGAAYQAGVVPVSATAIEGAIDLNGVAVEMNTQAFRIGRRIVAEPGFVDTLLVGRIGAVPAPAPLSGRARKLVERIDDRGELRRLLEVRVPELIAYQNARYASEYVDFVARVKRAEDRLGTGSTALAEAVATYLFKLMAYKDEYEVARLHLKAEFGDAVTRQFGAKSRLAYKLHPPTLRAMGVRRKIGFGRWIEPGFKALHVARRVRGTRFDPFANTEERRSERALIGEYRDLVSDALTSLTVDGLDRAIELASLPDMIRGYEQVKLDNVARFHERVQELNPRPGSPR